MAQQVKMLAAQAASLSSVHVDPRGKREEVTSDLYMCSVAWVVSL